jgi:putative transposase
LGGLNFFLVFGQKHFDYLVSSYLSHYNSVRPHQGSDIGNKPLTGTWPEVDEPLAEGEQIVCIESLGGVLKHYERRAA